MATTSLLPPSSPGARLTAAFRAAQARRAAAIAALVIAYYRTRVDPEDVSSVETWLDLFVPRILREHDAAMTQASLFATTLRKLEVPNAPELRYEPLPGAVVEQVRRSLLVVGPGAHSRKMTEIRALPDYQADPGTKTGMIRELDKATEIKISGAVTRHAQAGARETILRGVAKDKVALGWVRVTRDNPCYFCALLASRGIQKGYTYSEDSFDVSDSLFANGKVPGTAKVHDHCQCHLKPVYAREDDYAQRAEFFMSLYQQSNGSLSGEGGFRQTYNAQLAS